MYSVLLLKGRRTILEKKISTLPEVEEFLFGQLHAQPYKYEVYNDEDDTFIDEGELESADEIMSATMDSMFPNEDSMEGFDVDKFFNLD